MKARWQSCNKTIKPIRMRSTSQRPFLNGDRPQVKEPERIRTGTVIRVKFTEWYCSQIANLMIIFNRRVRVLLNSNTRRYHRR